MSSSLTNPQAGAQVAGARRHCLHKDFGTFRTVPGYTQAPASDCPFLQTVVRLEQKAWVTHPGLPQTCQEPEGREAGGQGRRDSPGELGVLMLVSRKPLEGCAGNFFYIIYRVLREQHSPYPPREHWPANQKQTRDPISPPEPLAP